MNNFKKVIHLINITAIVFLAYTVVDMFLHLILGVGKIVISLMIVAGVVLFTTLAYLVALIKNRDGSKWDYVLITFYLILNGILLGLVYSLFSGILLT